MSFAHFSENSDIYLFHNVGGWIECACCPLFHAHTARFFTWTDAIDHLLEHICQGHKVPESAIKRLERENLLGTPMKPIPFTGVKT